MVGGNKSCNGIAFFIPFIFYTVHNDKARTLRSQMVAWMVALMDGMGGVYGQGWVCRQAWDVMGRDREARHNGKMTMIMHGKMPRRLLT